VLRVLVEKGHLDVNTPNFQQLTPLHVAVAQRHVECAKRLLAYGCHVNVKVSVITSWTGPRDWRRKWKRKETERTGRKGRVNGTEERTGRDIAPGL